MSLTPAEQAHSAALMRVNHSGEICAQALYLGQALVARNENIAKALYQSADEEKIHLSECAKRIQELGGRTSRLNPIWAIGSFSMGIIAGLAGDSISLGFLAETEKQVTAHLEKHLNMLSSQDEKTRILLTQMKEDEQKHAAHAEALGAARLPRPICYAMKLASKIMTTTARYL